MCLLVVGLTIVVPFMWASLLGHLGSLKACCMQLLNGLVPYQNFTISLLSWVTSFIGCLFPSILNLRFWLRFGFEFELCCPILGLAGYRCFRSTARGELVVHVALASTLHHHMFLVVGQATWNSLPLHMHVVLARDSAGAFYKHFKTVLLLRDWVESAGLWLR